MKNTISMQRKCSALLATGASAAVCLTGGGAGAAFVSGNIAASNGTTVFSGNDVKLHACGTLASWFLRNTATNSRISFSGTGIVGALNNAAGYIVAHNAGVTVSNGLAGGFGDQVKVPSNLANKYFAIKFTDLVTPGSTRYGWLHVVSSNGTGTSMVIDKWGYGDDGATVKTLADSITARKLGLADGRVKLHWTNANEETVSRYEVQAKDAAGAWTPVSSDAAGAGQYSATAAKGADYRIVVENVDGTTQEISF